MTFDFLFDLRAAASLCAMLAALLYLTHRLFERYGISDCLLWLAWILAAWVDFALFCFLLVLAIDEIQKLPAPWPAVAGLCAVLGLIGLWVIHNRRHLSVSLIVILILAIPLCIISSFSQSIQTEIEKHQPLSLPVIILMFLIAFWIQSNSPLAQKILNGLAGVLLFIPMSLLLLCERAADWWKNGQRTKPKS